MLSLPIKKLDAFKFDGVAESGNTGPRPTGLRCRVFSMERTSRFNALYIFSDEPLRMT